MKITIPTHYLQMSSVVNFDYYTSKTWSLVGDGTFIPLSVSGITTPVQASWMKDQRKVGKHSAILHVGPETYSLLPYQSSTFGYYNVNDQKLEPGSFLNAEHLAIPFVTDVSNASDSELETLGYWRSWYTIETDCDRREYRRYCELSATSRAQQYIGETRLPRTVARCVNILELQWDATNTFVTKVKVGRFAGTLGPVYNSTVLRYSRDAWFDAVESCAAFINAAYKARQTLVTLSDSTTVTVACMGRNYPACHGSYTYKEEWVTLSKEKTYALRTASGAVFTPLFEAAGELPTVNITRSELLSCCKFHENLWWNRLPSANAVPAMRTHMDESVKYRLHQLRSEAFLAACDEISRVNDNTIQIISDIVKVIQAIRQNRLSELLSVPDSLSDAWLQYRYQYCTGKADISQAIEFCKRQLNSDLLGQYSGYGKVTIEDVTCRCNFKCHTNDFSKWQEVAYTLDRFGLCPDFYIVWDSLPYSFIVDWTLPIGEWVSRTDDSIRYSDGVYSFDYIEYSLSYRARLRANSVNTEYEGIPFSVYTRWLEFSPPDDLEWYYDYQKPSTSQTWTKRAIDALSLIIGKVR